MNYNTYQKRKLKEEACKILSQVEYADDLTTPLFQSLSLFSVSASQLENYRREKHHAPSDTISSRRERMVKQAINVRYWLDVYLSSQNVVDDVDDRLFDKLMSTARNKQSDFEEKVLERIDNKGE